MKSRNLCRVTGLLCTVAMLLAGCGQKQDEEAVKDILAVQQPRIEDIGIALLDLDDMFSNRDKEVGYDEASDTMIIMQGSSAACSSEYVQINGSTITITEEGTYILTGNLTNGSVVVDAEKSDKIQLVLMGAEITCESSAAIYVKKADKVFITLAADTANSLSVTGEFVNIDDNNIDGVIFSKNDLTLNGLGSLKITSLQGHGIVSKDDLAICGGNYEIEAKSHGLEGKDSVRIAGGNFQITAQKDGIHSENNDDSSLGFVYIADGEFLLTVGDDGIHAGAQTVIDGGNILITECYEGIEGQTVDICGGNITLTAEDDGINAASPSAAESTAQDSKKNGKFAGMGGEDPFEVDENCYIHISGGVLHVTASGDGLDSNGALCISGGETYVSGPENSGNGSLDYSGAGQITGGIFVAAGASGMAQNFGSTSTQAAMLVNLSDWQQSGSTVSLKSLDGAELVSFQAEAGYDCVIISCPELVQGNTYILNAGTESKEIEMTSLIYGAGGMGGGFGGMNGGHNGFGGGKGDMGGMRGDGETPPQMPDGETLPQMPDGETPPQMPDGQTLPQMPDGETSPQMPDGQTPPQMPENWSGEMQFPSEK